jgi:hypothetical protein
MPGQYIAAIIQPSVRTFAHEKGKASWGGTLAQLVIVTGIVGILNYVRVLVQAATMDAATAARVAAHAATGMPTLQEALSPPGPSTLISCISILVGFFIINGLFFLLAKSLSGTGTLLQQSYLTMLWSGPISILAGVVAFIPLIGNWLALAMSAYGVLLAILAIMGSHHLNAGRAFAVVFIPILLLCFLAICGFVFAAIAWECTVNFC